MEARGGKCAPKKRANVITRSCRRIINPESQREGDEEFINAELKGQEEKKTPAYPKRITRKAGARDFVEGKGKRNADGD